MWRSAVDTQMHWVRLNRRIGAWVALFALTLQLVLSFGHVHVAKSLLSSASATAVAQQFANRDGAPSSPQHRNGADDFCAICATIGLLASSALPEPASLVLPVAAPSHWRQEFTSTFVPFDSHLLFQARGPPTAA